MEKYLIITNPSDGHVNPMVPIVKELVKSGHEVKWINGRKFKELVRSTGAEFILMHQKFDRGDTDLYDFFPELKKLKGIPMLRFYFKHWLLDPVPFYVRQIEEVLQDFKADLIIGDSFRNCASFVHERGGPPFLMVNIFPLMYPSRYLPPQGIGMLPGSSWLSKVKEGVFRYIVYSLAYAPVLKHCNAIRKQLNLPPFDSNNFLAEEWKGSSLILHPTIPSFEYKAPDFPDNIHFIGPLLLKPDPDYSPPSWWSKIVEKRKKVILINQGTIAKKLEDLIIPAIEGLKGEDVYVIAVPVQEGLLQDVSPNVFSSSYVPFGNLLPYVDLVITNGGYGGVQNTLAHGIPLIVAGATEDKMEVSARVEYMKVGINLRTNHPAPVQIKEAVQQVFSTPVYQKNARQIAVEMAHTDAPKNAVQIIESFSEKEKVRITDTGVISHPSPGISTFKRVMQD